MTYQIKDWQPSGTITFLSNGHIELMRLSRDGIWTNPAVPVDELAQKVLEILDKNIKVLVQRAVEDEREACAKLCDAVQQQNEDDGAWLWEAKNCAIAIRARGEK